MSMPMTVDEFRRENVHVTEPPVSTMINKEILKLVKYNV